MRNWVKVRTAFLLYNIFRKTECVFIALISSGREGGKKVESKLLTLYSDIQSKPVQWLWRPYIPIGKVTLLQGDPNDGKSTMMMNIVAELSKGGAMPDGTVLGRPQKIIYQCSDGFVNIAMLTGVRKDSETQQPDSSEPSAHAEEPSIEPDR